MSERAGDETNGEARPRVSLSRSASAHPLPFGSLSPADFERLCLWLVTAEGYEDAEHVGLGGSDHGRDLMAYRRDPSGKRERWYFQCKRRKEVSPAALAGDIDKLVDLLARERAGAAGVVFMLACNASAQLRDATTQHAQSHGLACVFWARTELDAQTKRHPEIVAEFFGGGVWVEPAVSSDMVATYLRAIVDQQRLVTWPLDPRLAGQALTLDEHAIDIAAVDDRGTAVRAEDADRFERLVVLGGPGSGKTWFARRAVVACARRALQRLEAGDALTALRIPVCLTVAALRDQAGPTVRERAVSAALSASPDLGHPDSVRALTRWLSGHPDLFVALDAADEAPGSHELLRTADSLPWRLLLTTRSSAWQSQLRIDRATTAKASLPPLTYPDDVEAIISRWFGSTAVGSGAALVRHLRRSPTLQEMSRVPLLLAFLCILGAAELPDDEDLLLERVTTRLLLGPWRANDTPNDIDLRAAHDMVRRWAWSATRFDVAAVGIPAWSPTVAVSSEDGRRVAHWRRRGPANVCPPIGPPDLDTGEQQHRFIHRRIHEHLVASVIASLPPDEAATCLRHHLWAPGEWTDVLTAAVRLHPNRVAVVERLVTTRPFDGIAPQDVPIRDFDGHLDRVLLAFASRTVPSDASIALRSHVQHARLRNLSDPAMLEATVAWGLPVDTDLDALLEEIVPRIGGSIRDAYPHVPFLGLSAAQRDELRRRLEPRLAEDDGSFGSVIRVLVGLCDDEDHRQRLLNRLAASWNGERGWRRDELARAFETLDMPDATLRDRLIAGIEADLAVGRRLSWRLLTMLAERATALPDAEQRHLGATVTRWMEHCRHPYDAESLASHADAWQLSQPQSQVFIARLLDMLAHSSSDEWFAQERGVYEEQFASAQICRTLPTLVATDGDAGLVAAHLRDALMSNDGRTVIAAAEGLAALCGRYDEERAASIAAITNRHRADGSFADALGRYLDDLGAEPSADILYDRIGSADQLDDTAALLERHPTRRADVLARSVDGVQAATTAQELGRALRATAAVVQSGYRPTRRLAICQTLRSHADSLDVSVYAERRWFGIACFAALQLTSVSDADLSDIYRVVARAIVVADDLDSKKHLLRIVTGRAHHSEHDHAALRSLIDRLMSGSALDRQLACSTPTLLPVMTASQEQTFLGLLSTENEVVDVSDIRSLVRDWRWSTEAQATLWGALIRRFQGDSQPTWRSEALVELLTSWAQTTAQSTEIEDIALDVIRRLIASGEALRQGGLAGALTLPPVPELPTAKLAPDPKGQQTSLPGAAKTRLGYLLRDLRKIDVSERFVGKVRDLLIQTARGQDDLLATALFLQLAAAFGGRSTEGRTLARGIVESASDPASAHQAQLALSRFEPTVTDLDANRSWKTPPDIGLLRAVRANSAMPAWDEWISTY